MFVKQLSVFVENKPGRLIAVIDALSARGIDISALSIADTTDYGVVRMIVNDPSAAVLALNEIGVFVKITDVIAVTIRDSSGGLGEALHTITDAGVEIRYMYAFVGKISGKAIMVLKTDDMTRSVELLKNSATEVLSANDVYRL